MGHVISFKFNVKTSSQTGSTSWCNQQFQLGIWLSGQNWKQGPPFKAKYNLSKFLEYEMHEKSSGGRGLLFLQRRWAPSWHGSAFFSSRKAAVLWVWILDVSEGILIYLGPSEWKMLLGRRPPGTRCWNGWVQGWGWGMSNSTIPLIPGDSVLKKLQYSMICSHWLKRSFCRSSQIYVGGHHCWHCPKLKPIRMNQTLLIKIIKKDTPRTWIRSHQRIDVESAKSLVVKSTWMNHLKLIIQRYWI